MAVTELRIDRDTATVTVTCELVATPDRVWQLWADPRTLERWWGPVEWPARFDEHDLRVGGRSRYTMTGPDGQTASGWWEFTAVDPTTHLALVDGFADAAGEPDLTMPTSAMEVDVVDAGETTQMVLTSRMASTEQLDQLLAMGMADGLRSALGQIDALLLET